MEKPNQNVRIFVPTNGFATPKIRHGMWTQLKPMQSSTFSDDKRPYPSWNATFMACVDYAPLTLEYKVLHVQL